MRLSSLTRALISLSITLLPVAASLIARTLTGTYTGLVNPQYPNVREFRAIPYAQPPVGEKRWRPPVALSPNGKHTFSYRYPPACTQYLTKNITVWNSNITDFSISLDGQSYTAGTAAQTSSEDCLYLAIWTPLNVSSESNLPVAVFIPGGSFTNGGVEVPYQQPAPLVARRNELVVVTMNYRVGIMGFPNSASLSDQNLGILDQRMALEWVYSNIANFGGSPERIVLWGQSAGAVSADIHNFAFHDNPLVKGYFLQSGTAAVAGNPADPTYSNFTFVSKQLGCDFAGDPTAELSCMQQVPASLIANFVGQYTDNKTEPAVKFLPVPDEKIYFADYTARAMSGKMSGVPALVSTTSNEEASLFKYPIDNVTGGPNKTEVDTATVVTFVCSASNTTDWRAVNNLTTYRYQFAGNFSSITPLPWMSAYHASDVPLLFGTYQRRTGTSDLEKTVAKTMQDYVFAFFVDPVQGLQRKDWEPQNQRVKDGGTIVRFGGRSGAVVQNVSSLEIDNVCLGYGTYNSNP